MSQPSHVYIYNPLIKGTNQPNPILFSTQKIMSGPQTSVQLPLLDISQPFDSTSLNSLYQTCEEWGFFHIINHGISMDLYKKLYSHSKHLFTLPSDSKNKLGPSSPTKTYTPHFIASPFFESLRVSGPDFFASAKSSADILFDPPKPEFW